MNCSQASLQKREIMRHIKADPRLLSGDPLSTFYASKITLRDQSTLNADTSIFSLSAAA